MCRFISQIHSIRGQDRLLIGNNTSKVDRKLEIPPAIARKPRPLDILRGEERRASNLVGSLLLLMDSCGYHLVGTVLT
jgi:hypothetical protein